MSRKSRKRITPKTFPPAQVALFRKHLSEYFQANLTRSQSVPALERLLPAAARQDAGTVRDLQQTKAAELYWVDAEITSQAFDASQDVPLISGADAPASSGILFFENPLPPLPLDDFAQGFFLTQMALGARIGADTAQEISLGVAGIQWGLLEPGVLSVCAFALNPATGPTAGSSLLDPHIPLLFCDLPLAGEISIETLAEDKQRQAFLAFLSALWVLMRTPTVAQLAEGDIATGATRALPAQEEHTPRSYTVPDSRRVQVVQMLPMEHKEQQESGQRKTYRRSSYRWVVRGHWRNQAVGKNRTGRKLTWIASHLRGNPDGPLKTSEKVYAWRNS